MIEEVFMDYSRVSSKSGVLKNMIYILCVCIICIFIFTRVFSFANLLGSSEQSWLDTDNSSFETTRNPVTAWEDAE